MPLELQAPRWGRELIGLCPQSFAGPKIEGLRSRRAGESQSLSENGEGFCLGEKGSIGKARGGSRPAAVCDRQATPPAGPSLPNPPGGGSFRLGLRWFGRNRPQEVCPAAHRLAQPRIPQPQNPSPFSDRLSGNLLLCRLGPDSGVNPSVTCLPKLSSISREWVSPGARAAQTHEPSVSEFFDLGVFS